MLSDFGRRERIIDAKTRVAQHLDLRERIATPLFLRDDDINIELLSRIDDCFHPRSGCRIVVNEFTQDDIAHGEAERGNETAPSLSCATRLS